MKLGIVRPEMPREPRVQALPQLGRIDFLRVFKFIHNIAKLIKQSFVILLVASEPAVRMIPHELFFEGEVSGDALEQVAEEGGNRPFRLAGAKLLVKAVDQIDELFVLVIDRVDADAVFVLPLQQLHDAVSLRVRAFASPILVCQSFRMPIQAVSSMFRGRGCRTPAKKLRRLFRVFSDIFKAKLLRRTEAAMIEEAEEVALAPAKLGSNTLYS